MQLIRPLVLVLAPLLACGPKVLEGDTDGAGTDTSAASGESSGATTDGAGSSTANIGESTTGSPPDSSTGDPPDPTTATTTVGPTTATDATTSPPDPSDTGEAFPIPDGVESVVVLISRAGLGMPSGVEGIPQWTSANQESCEGDMVPTCDGAPVLGEPHLLVDGFFADVDAIKIGSRVAVLFQFEHPGCALGCGWSTASAFDDVEGGGGGGTLPADFPCGTESTGVWAAVDFGEIVRDGKHEASLRLDDRCQAESELRVVQFTL